MVADIYHALSSVHPYTKVEPPFETSFNFEEPNNGHFQKGTRRSRAKNQWATPVFDFLLTDAPNFERMGAGYLLHSTMAEIRSMKLP